MESSDNAVKYFLTKLKNTDYELNVANAELREVMEEIKLKESRINFMKSTLNSLVNEVPQMQNSRKTRKLKKRRAVLNSQIQRANNVLSRLGLIWVGEHEPEIEKPKSTDAANKKYRNEADTSHYNYPQAAVTPFSGRGYRLSTGSEIFADDPTSQKTKIILEKLPSSMDLPTRPICEANTPSASIHKDHITKPAQTITPLRQINADDNSDLVGQIPGVMSEKVNFPPELLRMTKMERQRAIRQTAVQIKKNMDKNNFNPAYFSK